ncbi:MAG TPA: right-handed parallel beta-helix repeat-containing protein, partial [Gemmatimonadaceae bacterium]|nr:right-handed parallel beta-helix repeat-containing protein [Gemmatimonadaceae bacterium]
MPSPRLVAAALLALPIASAAAQRARRLPVIDLRPGLVITSSVRIRPATYHLPAPASLDSAVVVIRGDNITVDFAGARMEGTDPHADPDRAAGVAIRIDGGNNVRVTRAHVRGYKVALMARHTRNLQLADNDFSYNWKPRLFSLVEHESLVDWQSFHHNEKDEWLRYGGAIYLADVDGGTIQGNTAEQGVNGLMLVRTNGLRIQDNSFSYNSGLGIGLYRSSRNTIVHNRVDYDVRGYSEGFYRRGQDSAGLLVYEQSDSNLVAYNSVTHGGDGLFLWAGQQTMDSGQGGANDNVFFRNDFSDAPTNGMEATFARNQFLANRIEGSDNGLWGGYSYESTVVGNCFARNRTGIAIEHGQDDLIAGNRFDGDETAINLWANPIEPSDWGYPKHRDTKSRDYRIAGNTFSGNRVALRIANTSGAVVSGNRFAGVDSVAVLHDTSAYRDERNIVTAAVAASGVKDPACGPDAALPAEYDRLAAGIARDLRRIPYTAPARRPRSAIVVDEWGPYDWRSPKLWPVDSTRANPLRLAVLGPAGRWKVVDRRGVTAISREAGQVGDTIAVSIQPDSVGDWALTLAYVGGATVSPRGEAHEAGEPYDFSYGHFEPRTDWTVRIFTWSDSTDPRTKADAFAAVLRGTPAMTRRESRIDYEWYRPTVPGIPLERWALDASASVDLSPGTYTLRTISDDAMRVWV